MASTTTAAPAGGDDPKRKRGARMGRNPTRAYRGSGGAWYGFGSAVVDGAPFFTWHDIPRMLRDPRVRFIERMWRAPFQKVKWAVKADTDKIVRFVDTTLRKFWRNSLPKLLSRYWRYGYAPGGAEFVARKGWWRLDQVRAIEPRDAQPRVWADGPDAGRPAGFSLSSALAGSGSGPAVGPPHAFWFAGYGELSDFYDMPPMAGLFEPWVEKRGRNGAIHSRRLWFRKCAYQGGTLYHPDGPINVGTDEDPQYRNAQDVARETLDYSEAGDTKTFFNDPNAADPSKYAWDYKPPEGRPDVAGVREYPKDLDGEMMEGAGIPSEVFEAADVGSGWSGRLIPLLGYLGTVDELAGLLIRATEPWLRPLVAANFGPSAWYEVEPTSLADEVAQQQGKGGGDSNPVPDLFNGKPPAPPAPGPQLSPAPGPQPLSLSATIVDPPAAPPKRYACAYVALPQDLADRVRALGRRIPESDLADKGRELEPHITIRYGLECDSADGARAILADAPPPRVSLGAASFFPAAETGKAYDVVKIDVASGDLRRLHRELATLPHHDAFPDYKPHITIGYVKAGRGAEWAERLGRFDAEFVPREAVFSDREKNKTAIAFGRSGLEGLPTPRELSAVRAPAPVELSWAAYEGPKGGKGWVSDSGEVRYQTEKPADGEGGEKGPEALFSHPDFAHVPEHTSAAEPRDFAAIKGDAHAAAEKASLDPAELHRRAAGRLHQSLTWTAETEGYRTPAKQLAHHEAMGPVERIVADHEMNQADHNRKMAALFPEGEPGRKMYEDKAAEHMAKAASAAGREGAHAAAAEKIRAGHVPPVKSSNHRNVLAGAYQDAHKDLLGEKEKRDAAAAFGDAYFEHDKPLRRAAKYLKATDAGDLDADLLSEDTRAAIVEDLSQIPPAKLAAHVAAVYANYGAESDAAEHQIATAAVKAAAAAKPPKPLAFDGGEPDGYFVVTADEAGEELYAGLRAAATLLPGVKAPLDADRAFMVKAGSPLAKLANDEHGIGYTLEDVSGLQPLFQSLKGANMLPQEHVPASAKDYGGTSGSKGSGEYTPEEGWDPAKVPVFRRVNEDWYIKSRPINDADSEPYELVHRKDVPPLARLPEVYWADYDDNLDADDDAVAEREKKEQKQSDEGATQKRDIDGWKKEIKARQGEVGKLKTAWQQALKGVPEDDRPDEPEWDPVDTYGLTDQFDSREEHLVALEDVHGDYENHVESLREAVEEAKSHGEDWHANRTAAQKAVDAQRSRWQEHFKDVPEADRPDEPDWEGDPDEIEGLVDTDLDDHAHEHRATIAELKPKIDAEDERHRALLARDEAAQELLDDPPLAHELMSIESGDGTSPNPTHGIAAVEKPSPAPIEDASDGYNELAESLQEAIAAVQESETPDPSEHDLYDEDPDLGDGPDEIDPGDHDNPREYAEALRARWQDGGAAKIHLDRQEKLLEKKEAAGKRPEYHAAAVEWAEEQAARYDEVAERAAAFESYEPADDVERAAAARGRQTAEAARAVAAKLRAAAAKHRAGGPKELSATLDPGEAAAAGAIPGRLMRQRKAVLARLLTLAMVREQQAATAAGTPDAAAGSIARLAKLAGDPAQVARIVGMTGMTAAPPEPVELSWVAYEGPKGGKGWKDSESGRVVYQRDQPGKHAERKASAAAAREILGRVHSGKGLSAADLRELPRHIPLLTKGQLSNARILLEGKWGVAPGVRAKRDDMVNALLTHVGGLAKGPATGLPGLAGNAARDASEPAPPPKEVAPSAPPPNPEQIEGDIRSEIAGLVERGEAPKGTGAGAANELRRLVRDGLGGRHDPAALDKVLDHLVAEGAIGTMQTGAELAKRAKDEGADITDADWFIRTQKPDIANGWKGDDLIEHDGERVRLSSELSRRRKDGLSAGNAIGVDRDGSPVLIPLDRLPRYKKPDPAGKTAAVGEETPPQPDPLDGATIERTDRLPLPGPKVNPAPVPDREPGLEELEGGPKPSGQVRSRRKGDPLSPAQGDRFATDPTSDKPAPKKPRTPRNTGRADDAAPTAEEFAAASAKPAPSAPPASAAPSPAMDTPAPVPPPPPPAEPPPAPEPPRAPTDRGSLDSIQEATDRALGVKKPAAPKPPAKGEYGAWLRAAAADPAKFAEVQALAPSPLLDRNELLAAALEVYGPAVHAEAKKKSKQGIAELLRGAKPV